MLPLILFIRFTYILKVPLLKFLVIKMLIVQNYFPNCPVALNLFPYKKCHFLANYHCINHFEEQLLKLYGYQ